MVRFLNDQNVALWDTVLSELSRMSIDAAARPGVWAFLIGAPQVRVAILGSARVGCVKDSGLRIRCESSTGRQSIDLEPKTIAPVVADVVTAT